MRPCVQAFGPLLECCCVYILHVLLDLKDLYFFFFFVKVNAHPGTEELHQGQTDGQHGREGSTF